METKMQTLMSKGEKKNGVSLTTDRSIAPWNPKERMTEMPFTMMYNWNTSPVQQYTSFWQEATSTLFTRPLPIFVLKLSSSVRHSVCFTDHLHGGKNSIGMFKPVIRTGYLCGMEQVSVLYSMLKELVRQQARDIINRYQPWDWPHALPWGRK